MFNNRYIFGGDWNLLLNSGIETYNYININKPRARDKVLEIIGQVDLVDIPARMAQCLSNPLMPGRYWVRI